MRDLVAMTFVLASLLAGCTTDPGDGGDDVPAGFCGDGLRQDSESCDDGNAVAGDGCSATCQQEAEPGRITASWSFKSVATDQLTGCPSGFDTAAVIAQPIDAGGAAVGAPIVDLYTCADGTGTAGYPLGRYTVWIEIQDASGAVHAQSLSADLDITDNDKTFTATLLDDGGYFQLDWALRGAMSNQPLSCTQAGDPDAIEIISTLTGTSQAAVDKFNCEAGTGVTGALLQGAYTCSVGAEEANVGIGTAPTLTNQVIQAPNRVTDLGTITIPIDGL